MSKPTIDEQVAILMRGAEYGDEQIKEHMPGRNCASD